MKKFLAIFLIGMVVIVGALFFHRWSEALLQGESPSQDQASERSLPQRDKRITESGRTAPVSNGSTGILLVNASNQLPQNYKPVELLRLYEQKGRHFQLAESDIEVCATVFDAMERMFAAAGRDDVSGFIITSGYRSFAEQAEIFATDKNGNAARPGTSEHETGLAFDVTAYGKKNFERTPQFAWLSKHCAEYGFIIRYPQGKEDVTGYPYEPWHYRYVGSPAAKEIMDKGIALEEYLEQS